MTDGDGGALKELSGQIERIVYNNTDNGYTVLRLSVKGYPEPVTAVGYMTQPSVGAILHMKGNWTNHPKFGMQFQVESSVSEVPSSLAGVERYLASGVIKGVGPAMAERIVAKFGDETIDVLDNDPERLREVPGIGPKKALSIRTSWEEQSGARDVMLFLQNYGIGAGYAIRIYRHYGNAAIEVLKENPYRLAIDIFGIGFLTADSIASSMGFAEDSPFRVRAGVLHTMNEFAREGHIYVPIEKLVKRTSELLNVSADLAEEGVEAARMNEEVVMEWFGGSDGDDNCAVYLPAFQYAEEHSAKNFAALANEPYTGGYLNADAVIPWVQEELDIKLAEKQEEALRTALENQVMVITGGPGTGKTTLIKAVLALKEARGYRVMLAAPTGRAAKRMAEATGHEAKTIHRMLEYTGGTVTGGDFIRNDTNPLECDLLIVDEASMIDQVLFHHLLKAVPKGAGLILVGDINQLPSVGPGNVLKDVIESGACPVVRLSDIFRQSEESTIVVNAHRINSGEYPITKHGPGLKDFYIINQDDPQRVFEIITKLVSERIPERFGFDKTDGIQVLTPMHRGTVGTSNLNSALQKILNDSGGAKVIRMGKTFQEGDKVMQIRNDYDKDVYNGDIGRIISIDGEGEKVSVMMDTGLISYGFDELDELVHAYAVSIHKSQGSEYPAVVIPMLTQHYVMLQRNLLYTGVTRGKKLVIIVGSKKAIAIALHNDRTKKRYTRLAERLRKLTGQNKN